MVKVKKLNPLSFGRFQAVLGALLGLIAGIVYSFGGFIIDAMVTLGWMTCAETSGLSYGTLLAFGSLVGMPLIGLVVGLVVGFVSALLYNVFAKWFGFVNLKIEQE